MPTKPAMMQDVQHLREALEAKIATSVAELVLRLVSMENRLVARLKDERGERQLENSFVTSLLEKDRSQIRALTDGLEALQQSNKDRPERPVALEESASAVELTQKYKSLQVRVEDVAALIERELKQVRTDLVAEREVAMSAQYAELSVLVERAQTPSVSKDVEAAAEKKLAHLEEQLAKFMANSSGRLATAMEAEHTLEEPKAEHIDRILMQQQDVEAKLSNHVDGRIKDMELGIERETQALRRRLEQLEEGITSCRDLCGKFDRKVSPSAPGDAMMQTEEPPGWNSGGVLDSGRLVDRIAGLESRVNSMEERAHGRSPSSTIFPSPMQAVRSITIWQMSRSLSPTGPPPADIREVLTGPGLHKDVAKQRRRVQLVRGITRRMIAEDTGAASMDMVQAASLGTSLHNLNAEELGEAEAAICPRTSMRATRTSPSSPAAYGVTIPEPELQMQRVELVRQALQGEDWRSLRRSSSLRGSSTRAPSGGIEGAIEGTAVE